MPRILRNLKINEVSGVDKGAGRGVKIMLMKRDDDDDDIDWTAAKREFSSKERQSAASSGAALPDGSFPIKNKGDLKNAIQAIGRAKNPAKAKAHIKSRARALGASDMLPDTWKRDDSAALEALNASIASIIEDDEIVEKAYAVNESIEQFNEYMQQETADMTPEEIKKMVDDAVKVASAEFVKDSGSKPSLDNDDDKDDKPPAKKAKAAVEGDDKPDDSVAKRDDEIEKRFVSLAKENDELRKQVNEMVNARREQEFRKRAVETGLKEEDGEVMRKAFDGDVEAQGAFTKRISESMSALKAQAKTSVIFGEFGKAGGSPTSAYAEIEGKAAELRKADPKLTQAQAFAKAYTDPANRELIERDKAEQANKLVKLAAGQQ